MKHARKTISDTVAHRLSARLVATLGTPEGSSGMETGSVWVSESTWRYRTDDGSSMARHGYGPTRKMVTLRSAVQPDGTTSYVMFVYNVHWAHHGMA